MSPGAFDASKPLKTRDGRAVSGLYRQPDYVRDYIHAGRVENLPSLQTWASDGSYIIGQTSCLDLVNVPAPASPAGGGEDVAKLPQEAIDAWATYDPPEMKLEYTRLRHAFMAGWLSHRSASQATRDEVIEECVQAARHSPTLCNKTADEIAEAIRALKQEPASDGWLPIDSAPRDGTSFLGWTNAWGDQVNQCRWLSGPQRWNTTMQPTYWRPLPCPPSGEPR